MNWRLLCVLMLLPVVTACSAYHPLREGVGFTEIPLGQNAFQVTFTGESSMRVAEARQYCLTRAAELAVMRDMPFFQIMDERIFIGHGSSYMPPMYSPAYRGRGRYGYWGRGYGGFYEPGYVQTYTIPEVTMVIHLTTPDAPNAIPAAYLLRQAKERDVKLSPGVEERLAGLPLVTGEVRLPAAPEPATKPVQ
jgi:hypothetical protein